MTATDSINYESLSLQLPGLRKYLIQSTKKSSSSTRKMDTYVFKNIRVGGELTRFKIWEVSFFVSFYCSSTELAQQHFCDNYEYQRWVKKNKIGLFNIKKDILENIHNIPWWSYDLDLFVFYNHEHTTKSLKLGGRSFFEIEIKLFPPDTLSIANDVSTVKTLHKEASEWASKLNCFKPNEYIQFSPTTKKIKNIK